MSYEQEIFKLVSDIYRVDPRDISTLKSAVIEGKRALDIIHYLNPKSKMIVKTDEPCVIVCPDSSAEERLHFSEKLKEIGFTKFLVIGVYISEVMVKEEKKDG